MKKDLKHKLHLRKLCAHRFYRYILKKTLVEQSRYFIHRNSSNIKVIGSDVYTSVYDKSNGFGIRIVNIHWLSGNVPRLPSYSIYKFLSW